MGHPPPMRGIERLNRRFSPGAAQDWCWLTNVPSVKTPLIASIKTVPAGGVRDDAMYTVTAGVTPCRYNVIREKMKFLHNRSRLRVPDQAKVMVMKKTLATAACLKL